MFKKVWIAVVVTILSFIVWQYSDCQRSGGQLVKGLFSYVCVNAR